MLCFKSIQFVAGVKEPEGRAIDDVSSLGGRPIRALSVREDTVILSCASIEHLQCLVWVGVLFLYAKY